MITNLLLVGAGGAVGSMLRYLCQRFLNPEAFPYGTLIVNVAGCFLAGLLAGIFLKNGSQTSLTLFLITGFCGGFTTFSAFSLDSIQLLQRSQFLPLGLYTGVSVVGGLLSAFLGLKISL
jgi:CrcB protein